MKKNSFIAALLGLLTLCSTQAFAKGVDFAMDVYPGAALFSSDIDGFEVRKSSFSTTYVETIDGTGSWFPSLRAGIGFDTGQTLNLDILAGVGWIYNSAFEGSFVTLEVAPRFKLGRAVTLGFHFGLISVDDELDWDTEGVGYTTNNDIKITGGGDGVFGGITFTVGHKVSFVASLDAVSVDEYKVNTYNGWTANMNTLDISGTALSLGVNFRF